MADEEEYVGHMDYTTAEEKQPINSVERGEYPDGKSRDNATDSSVMVRQKRGPQNPGCFVSKGQATALFIFILVLLSLTGLLVYFLAVPKCEEEQEESFYLSTYKPKPTVEPGLPWSSIRLPDHYEPSYYELELKVDLDTFLFEGSVEIQVKMTASTDYMIVHTNALEISDSSVTVQLLDTKEELEILDRIPVEINQFYVLQMGEPLQRNKKYLVKFGEFTGHLQDDLRGIYRSSYKDNKGKNRYLLHIQICLTFSCYDDPNHNVVLTP